MICAVGGGGGGICGFGVISPAGTGPISETSTGGRTTPPPVGSCPTAGMSMPSDAVYAAGLAMPAANFG